MLIKNAADDANENTCIVIIINGWVSAVASAKSISGSFFTKEAAAAGV